MTGTANRNPVLTGGCQCGAVRYALYAAPFAVNVCHCRMCQKAGGSPYMTLISNQAANFAWTRGTPGTFASSTLANRDFCRDCGTPLTYRGPSGRVSVSYGSLDEPARVTPSKQYGMEGRMAWIDTLAAIPGVRTEDDMTPEEAAAIVTHQHPDHDTAEGWNRKG